MGWQPRNAVLVETRAVLGESGEGSTSRYRTGRDEDGMANLPDTAADTPDDAASTRADATQADVPRVSAKWADANWTGVT